MDIKETLELNLAPLVVMVYGLYLRFSLNEFADLASIVIVMVALLGISVSYVIYFSTKRFRWHNRWYSNIIIGVIGVILSFLFMASISR